MNLFNETFFYFLNRESLENGTRLTCSEAPLAKTADFDLVVDVDDTHMFIPKSPFAFNASVADFLLKYVHKKRYSFTSFFINNLVDVPVCFKKSVSLKRPIMAFPFLKFANYYLKKGEKEKAIRSLMSALAILSKNFYKKKTLVNSFLPHWFYFYLAYAETFFFEFFDFDSTNFYFVKPNSSLVQVEADRAAEISSELDNEKKKEADVFKVNLKSCALFTALGKEIDESYFYKNIFNTLFFKVVPLFSFFIYSVDKNIRKFSRGKSGKYVFLWKFIPPHKRKYLIMRLLSKDSKFYSNKQFTGRIAQSFVNLLIDELKSFVYKSKVFSHNYVFKNHKKTLLANFKTTS